MTLKAIPLTLWTRKEFDTFMKDNLPVDMDPILKGKKAPPAGINKDILWTFAIENGGQAAG